VIELELGIKISVLLSKSLFLFSSLFYIVKNTNAPIALEAITKKSTIEELDKIILENED
jgi:hypothetical protein